MGQTRFEIVYSWISHFAYVCVHSFYRGRVLIDARTLHTITVDSCFIAAVARFQQSATADVNTSIASEPTPVNDS